LKRLKASEAFRKIPVNHVEFRHLDQETCEVIIFKAGWKRPYKFKAKRLGRPDEEILEDEIVE